MIKLVVSDLDNTLLEKDNKINDKTLTILKECLSKGVFIVLGTGRLYQSAKIYKDMIGEETYIICYNGKIEDEYKKKRGILCFFAPQQLPKYLICSFGILLS